MKRGKPSRSARSMLGWLKTYQPAIQTIATLTRTVFSMLIDWFNRHE